MEKKDNLPKLPWKLNLQLSFFSFIMKLCCRSDGTVNRRLFRRFDRKMHASETPIDGVRSFDTVVDASRDLWFRVYTPTLAQPQDGVKLPFLILFHGGGFVFNTADSAGVDATTRRLAKEVNAIVFSVNYRLAPEHRFPCQYEDGFDALTFIDEKLSDDYFARLCDPNQCFLVGESAGGNLAHHVAVKAGNYQFRNLNIAGLISIQPFFGGEERTEYEKKLRDGPLLSLALTDRFWKAFLPEGSDRDHPAANVYGPEAVDISAVNFPATLLVVGRLDPLLERQRRYYEELKKGGKEIKWVEYPTSFHGFSGLPDLPEASLFLEEVREFVKKMSEE